MLAQRVGTTIEGVVTGSAPAWAGMAIIVVGLAAVTLVFWLASKVR